MLLDKLSLLLPRSHKKLQPDEKRKWLTVLMINIITIMIQFVYLYRYNFLHFVYSANFIILPCLIFNLLAFYFYFKKNYFYAALFVLLPGTLDLIYLIFTAGGMEAPGTFWIAILPFFFGTFFDKKGAIVGTVVAFSTYIFYWVIGTYIEMPTVTATHNEYISEKIMNLFNYSIITAFYYISYTAAYEKSSKTLMNQKNTIDNLFRVVLHDMTNPISSAKLRLALMKKQNSIADIDKVDESLNRATKIIDSLRSFKAIEDGSVEIPLKEEHVEELILEFIGESLEKVKEKDIKIIQNIVLGSETKIKCHRESFKSQVLLNLLTNALKFSEKNSSVEISAYECEKNAYIEIKDRGIGIPKQILDNIFRFDKATSRIGTSGEQGTGYGLPITKYFIEAMGGKVSVSTIEKAQENEKCGTQFKIEFPKVLST